MTILINLVVFVLMLGFIVFIHEFGHFIFSKMCGVYVYEFALGMGPKIWSKKGKETEYSLRAIPIGGFCQLAGEDVETDDLENVPEDRRLQSKSCFQRFLIMFFGAGNNFIGAILILFISALIWGGMTMDPVVTKVEKDFPAAEVGLQKGDTILSINNQKIDTSDDITLYLALATPTKKNNIEVEKGDGTVVIYAIKPKMIKENGNTTYRYGIEIKQKKTTGFVSSIVYTFKKTKSLFKQMAITVKALFTGGVKINQLSGPVGIYSIVGEQRKSGLQQILYLVAYLSVNVGFINLLPLPAFDGGHIVFLVIEKIKGSKVSPEFENKVHTVGLVLLMLLMVYITFNDIIKLF